MTAEQFVKQEFPHAYAERYKYNGPGNRGYYLIWSQRTGDIKFRLSDGKTKSNAWVNAKKLIQEMKTKNPLK